MNLKDQIKPITYLKNKTAEIVREVSETGRPMVITQNGEAKVVVMDAAEYSRWQDTLAMLKLVALGEADADAGRLFTEEEAFKRVEAKIKKRESNG